MTFLSRRARVAPTTARLTAIAGLIGATVLLSPLAASADPVAPHHHAMRHATAAERTETVEQRITRLHAALKITPEEETNWTAVAQVMRDNEAKMQSLISAKAAEPAQTKDAVDDLKTYEQFTQAHSDGLKTLISSFEVLYNAMPDDQKRVADQVFQKFGHRRASQS